MSNKKLPVRTQLSARLKPVVHRLFPTRQIYFRANGKVRFLSLSPRVQGIAAIFLFAAVAWVGVASYNYMFGQKMLAQKTRELAEARAAFNRLSGEMARLEGDVMRTVHTVEARQRYLKQLLEAEADRPPQSSPKTSETQAKNEGPIPDNPGLGGPVDMPPAAELIPETATAAPADEPASESPSLWERMRDWWSRITRRTLDDRAERRSDRVSAVEMKVHRLDAGQQRLITRMIDRADARLARLSKPFEIAGLSADAAIKHGGAATANAGGPLKALSKEARDRLAAGRDDAFGALVERHSRIDGLTRVLRSFPVIKPLFTQDYYISSSFGVRRDPFKGIRAFHGGLDMASHWKTPIHATVPGKVTFVGRNGPYGRMIEIDHGHGFKTRYGHLRTILVNKGQKVGQGERIALMGTSGRSTGTHLHYEVRFLDKPRNPTKFFKAEEYVLQPDS